MSRARLLTIQDYCLQYFHEVPESALFVSLDEQKEYKHGISKRSIKKTHTEEEESEEEESEESEFDQWIDNEKNERMVCFFQTKREKNDRVPGFDGTVWQLEVSSYVLEHCRTVKDAVERDFAVKDCESYTDETKESKFIKPYRREIFMRFPDGYTVIKQPQGADGQIVNSPIVAPLFETRVERSLNVICVGKNYREHVGEVDTAMKDISEMDSPREPIIFTKSARSMIGHGELVMLPDPETFDECIDYEGEVALVIGNKGKVYGATIVNDITARVAQKRHQQWFLGKSCDTFCPIGPWIVPWFDYENSSLLPFYESKDFFFAEGSLPRDVVLDTSPSEPGGSCTIVTRVNGEMRQNFDIAQEQQTDPPAMLFGHEELLETIEKSMELHPCDIIATGTPAGVGAAQKPNAKWLKNGDIVEVKVGGIGVLTNFINGHKHDPSQFDLISADEHQPKYRMFRQTPNTCGRCNKFQRKMSRCSRCKRIFYCSKECNEEDWKERHAKECNEFIAKGGILANNIPPY